MINVDAAKVYELSTAARKAGMKVGDAKLLIRAISRDNDTPEMALHRIEVLLTMCPSDIKPIWELVLHTGQIARAYYNLATGRMTP
jgi:hypothetical protein